MEFDEVNRFLQHNKRAQQQNTENEALYHQPLLFNFPSSANSNTIENYEATPTVNTVTRKPTISDFVHKLKHQSSTTKFAKNYKRMLDEEKDKHPIEDNADVRIIDSLQVSEPGISPSSADIDTESAKESGRKGAKRVCINEDANQQRILSPITPTESSSISSLFVLNTKNDVFLDGDDQIFSLSNIDPIVPFDIAMQDLKQHIERLQYQIENEMQIIQSHREAILHYRRMLDTLHHEDLSEHLYDQMLSQQMMPLSQELKEIQEKMIIENTLKIQIIKQHNETALARFERKYCRHNNSSSRKQMDVEGRLKELEEKIRLAYKRHEIWSGIRDWGLFLVLLSSLILATLFAWQ